MLDRVITIEPKDFSPGWSPLRDAAKGKPIVMTIEQLAEQMVRVSDNTACDALLRIVTPQAVTRRMQELGVKDVRVDRQERDIAAELKQPGGVDRYMIDARDTSTPDAMLALFIAIAQRRDGLSPVLHDKLVRWMTETKTGPNRIKAGVPKGTVVAHKTGTMPRTMNDVGIIDGRYVIAIFTKNAKSRDEDVESDIAAVTKKAYEALR